MNPGPKSLSASTIPLCHYHKLGKVLLPLHLTRQMPKLIKIKTGYHSSEQLNAWGGLPLMCYRTWPMIKS